MSNRPGDMEDTGRWPVDDDEAEALLAGVRTERDELVSLERFLREVRTPHRGPSPRPSGELARLFSEGSPAGAFDAPPTTRPIQGPMPREPRRAGAPGKPVGKMARVAVATTTAALAVTLAAAAQVLPRTQTKTSVGVSGPATPVQLGADQSIASGTSEVTAGASAGVTVQPPTTSVAGRTSVVGRSGAGPDLNSLTGDALARLPIEVLRTLPGDTLARLPVEVLKTLPGDALARLPVETLKTLPGDALARLPVDLLKALPGDVLARLPVDALRALPGDALARLPLDVLRTLPADVQSRLPADVLRLLLLSTSPTVTTSTTGAARP